MNENSREYNEISDLLDSIESDDTLERKMDAFKAKKSRKDRLKRKRAEEQALEKEAQETISIEPIKTVPETSETAGHTVAMPKLSSELQDKKPAHAIAQTQEVGVHAYKEEAGNTIGGQTAVFHPSQVEADKPDTNKTIVLDDEKVQTIIENSRKNPVLERKVVHEQPKKITFNADMKKSLAVLCGVLLVLVLGFGLFHVISSQENKNDQSVETTDMNYKRLLDWAEGYDTLSNAEKEEITSYENMYNRLSNDKKAKIDDILQDKTGSSFSELLKKAKKEKSAKAKNNNVKNAEKKAKLRSKIASLQSQLNAAQSELDSANNSVSSIQSQIDSLNQQISSEQNTLNSLQSAVTQAQSALESAGDGEDTTELEAQLQKALNDYNDGLSSYNSKVANLNNQISTYNNQLSDAQNTQSTAQNKVDNLNAQIASLQEQLNALK